MSDNQSARYRRELAKDVLWFIVSLQSAAICKERSSVAPDVAKLAELRETSDFYMREQDLVVRGNDAAIERALTVHYPKFQIAYDEFANAPMTPAEQQRRQDAIDYARASVRMEGIPIDEAFDAHARRFINGELNMVEFMAGL